MADQEGQPGESSRAELVALHIHDGLAQEGPLHPKLKALLDYWRSKCGGHSLPARADLPVKELKPWLGHLALIDSMADGDFRIRLCGTELIPRFGREITGLTVGKLDNGIRDGFRSCLSRACAAKAPVVVALSVRFQGRRALYSELVLPFGDTSAAVAMLLMGSYMIHRE